MSDKKRVTAAYNKLNRSDFMESDKSLSHIDRPFSIGYEQTISQPSLVLKMTMLLDIKKTDKVLEIGTGSGFQTALLSLLAKEVYTVEIIEELYMLAKKRLNKLGYRNINFRFADGKLGWKEFSPFERIMVTACAKEIPKALIDQLADNGKMVIVVDSDFAQDLVLISKKDNKIYRENISKVNFVDLV